MNKFTKIFVAALAAVAIFASAASASYTHSGLLKMGMTSSQVMSLQQTLNGGGFLISTTGAGSPGMESTHFGAKTKAAVMAFQSAKGLHADGVVGAQTGTALAAMTGGSVSYPAGCMSTSGFSSVTGLPCTSTAGSTLPTGCTSTSGFSPVTGASCSGSTTGGTTTGPLSGTAGDINVTAYSSGLETQVGEGSAPTKILGFEVKADAGSDVNLSSVKVSFVNSGSGSKRFTRYANTVSIFAEDGTKIGSSSVADFSESSNTYSRSIAVSSVVRANQKARFFISVDGLSNIDSTDYNTDAWTATLNNIRFSDASGAILTNSTAVTRAFNFTSLSGANDLELKVNLSSSNMKATTVKASTTTSTNDVELLKFTLKAQGGKMHLRALPVTFTTSGATNISVVTGNVTLKLDGSSFSKTVSDVTTSSTVVFNDLNLDIAADDTITGTVTADVNSLGSNSSIIAQGATLQAQVGSLASFDVEDVNGDAISSATSDITGSAVGETMTFRSTGVNVVMGSMSSSDYTNTVDQNGNVTSSTYNIPVTVTSFGNTLYTAQSAVLGATVTGSNAFAVAFQNSAAPTVDDVAASATITLSSTDAVVQSGSFRLDDGQPKHFTLSVRLNTPTSANASYRVSVKQAKTWTTADLGTGSSVSDLIPVEQFRTDYKFINN
jgi:hypothetical protein